MHAYTHLYSQFTNQPNKYVFGRENLIKPSTQKGRSRDLKQDPLALAAQLSSCPTFLYLYGIHPLNIHVAGEKRSEPMNNYFRKS